MDGLMVRKETDNIKQEFKLSDAVMQIKKEGEELTDFQKKKKIKQHPPAKIVGMNEDGSLGLQSARPHVCEHCSATFRTNYHLQRHAFIHTGEKPFQCSHCDMRFIQKYLLQRHEKIHTGEKPYRCDECGMKFIQKYHMERHKRTHSGEKPYQCSHCQQLFSRTDRVLKHQRLCRESRRADELHAGDGLALSEQGLGHSPLPGDRSRPKKQRHKANDKPWHPVRLEGGEGREEPGPGSRERPSPYSRASKVKDEYEPAECSAERRDSAVGIGRLAEVPAPEANASRNDVLKTPASRKRPRKPAGLREDSSPTSSLDDGNVARYAFQLADKPGFPGLESHADLDPRRGAPGKPAASSTNYDDAVQFLKKRRYLQAGGPSSSRDGTLNAGIAAQTSGSRSAGASIGNDAATACTSNSHAAKTEVKSTQDKNILTDEVFQTLLDHYSNKAGGQPEVSFGVDDTEVTSRVSVHSSDVSAGGHVEALGMSAQAPPSGNAGVLQEYSKFLQQTLERTSQNDSYLNTQSLTCVPKSQSLSHQPKFSAIDTHYTSSSRSRSGMNPSLSTRMSSEKSHFGLLFGDSQHSFSFSGEETNPSSVSSTEDFLEQVTPPKKSDSQVTDSPFQIGAFEQNLRSQFQSSGSAVSSLFSFSSGAVNLHGHESGTDFSEYPLASVADGRTPPTSSLDSTGSQMYS
ncbi:zinc finger protein 148-like [Anguilla rostrata]|uniref:zinc finger protein 148-like n=1 Tax=Anguilla rostrata TaxID=7938 RepID=UPI0030D5F87A